MNSAGKPRARRGCIMPVIAGMMQAGCLASPVQQPYMATLSPPGGDWSYRDGGYYLQQAAPRPPVYYPPRLMPPAPPPQQRSYSLMPSAEAAPLSVAPSSPRPLEPVPGPAPLEPVDNTCGEWWRLNNFWCHQQ